MDTLSGQLNTFLNSRDRSVSGLSFVLYVFIFTFIFVAIILFFFILHNSSLHGIDQIHYAGSHYYLR